MATTHAKTKRRGGASKPARTSRLEARITKAQKTLIERAAACQGRSVSDFVVTALASAAEAAINEHETIRLNPAQSLAFVKALLNPPKPNAALRRAAREHDRTVLSR